MDTISAPKTEKLKEIEQEVERRGPPTEEAHEATQKKRVLCRRL
jgi:hypothetical protein